MNSKTLVCLSLLALICTAWAQEPVGSGEPAGRESSLKHIFGFHASVADSLGLAGSLQPVKFKAVQKQDTKSTAKGEVKPEYKPRVLESEKKTVFGQFKVQIVEFKDRFVLNIHSENPAQEIVVKDRRKGIVYLTKPLNDEKEFSVKVEAVLSRDIGVSVAVMESGTLNQAYFNLLGD